MTLVLQRQSTSRVQIVTGRHRFLDQGLGRVTCPLPRKPDIILTFVCVIWCDFWVSKLSWPLTRRFLTLRNRGVPLESFVADFIKQKGQLMVDRNQMYEQPHKIVHWIGFWNLLDAYLQYLTVVPWRFMPRKSIFVYAVLYQSSSRPEAEGSQDSNAECISTGAKNGALHGHGVVCWCL